MILFLLTHLSRVESETSFINQPNLIASMLEGTSGFLSNWIIDLDTYFHF